MQFKIVIALLFCLALTDARPTETNSIDESTNLDDIIKYFETHKVSIPLEEKTPIDKLISYALWGLYNVSDYSITEFKQISNKMLLDMDTQKSSNPVLAEELTNFREFISHADNLKSNNPGDLSFLAVFVEFCYLVDKYDFENKTEVAQPTPEQQLISDSLHKNGLKILDTEFENRFGKFLDGLGDHLSTYSDSLNDNKTYEELKPFIQKLKETKKLENKLKLIVKILSLLGVQFV